MDINLTPRKKECVCIELRELNQILDEHFTKNVYLNSHPDIGIVASRTPDMKTPYTEEDIKKAIDSYFKIKTYSYHADPKDVRNIWIIYEKQLPKLTMILCESITDNERHTRHYVHLAAEQQYRICLKDTGLVYVCDDDDKEFYVDNELTQNQQQQLIDTAIEKTSTWLELKQFRKNYYKNRSIGKC